MTRLHHVAVGTPDVERLAAFYRDVLGLAEVRRHTRAEGLRSIWLELEGAVLMIERSDAAPPRVEGVGNGAFLLAFRVTPGERERLEATLERAGVPIESRTEFTSYARDPDGNRFAISHYPFPSRAPGTPSE